MLTKQKILTAALTLFSEKGYEAVSVGQIAESVGIKAPSLYKHYKNKQDIFDAIVAEMAVRYNQQMASMRLNGNEAAPDSHFFSTVSEEQLLQIGFGQFQYFLHDEYVRKFRRMMTLEQYHNQALAKLLTKQYVDDPLSYQGLLFHLLIQAGIFRNEDQNIMALHFYSPVYFLLTLCDRHPEREENALQILKEHIKQFNRLYRKEEL